MKLSSYTSLFASNPNNNQYKLKSVDFFSTTALHMLVGIVIDLTIEYAKGCKLLVLYFTGDKHKNGHTWRVISTTYPFLYIVWWTVNRKSFLVRINWLDWVADNSHVFNLVHKALHQYHPISNMHNFKRNPNLKFYFRKRPSSNYFSKTNQVAMLVVYYASQYIFSLTLNFQILIQTF